MLRYRTFSGRLKVEVDQLRLRIPVELNNEMNSSMNVDDFSNKNSLGASNSPMRPEITVAEPIVSAQYYMHINEGSKAQQKPNQENLQKESFLPTLNECVLSDVTFSESESFGKSESNTFINVAPKSSRK